MKDDTIKVYDSWLEKASEDNIDNIYYAIIEITDKLKKCEEALEKVDLGIGYDERVINNFNEANTDREIIYDFICNLIPYIEKNIDIPFKEKLVDTALSPLLEIKIENYEIENDIGVKTLFSDYNNRLEIREKEKLNLKDFLGSENEDKKYDQKDFEQVDDFAEIFKAQYLNIKEEMEKNNPEVSIPDMRKFWDPESMTSWEQFKEFLSIVADATIIVPIIDAIVGKDIITGRELSEDERKTKVIIAGIDTITLGLGALSSPVASEILKEYALAIGTATANAVVDEVIDSSGLPSEVISILKLGAGIITEKVGRKVLFKNAASEVIATKDIDELKKTSVRGNKKSPHNIELDDKIDDVGLLFGDEFWEQYYEPWPGTDGSLDELSRYSRDIDVGSVSGRNTVNTLTDAQKSRLNSLENTINDHLTEGDFSGTLRDLQGKPVPNGKGGYFDHLGEMKDSYSSLKKIRKGLEGSLKNPNLSDVDRALLQEGLDKANLYIERIQEMFKPYGGIE